MRAGSPEAGAIVCIVVAATRIVATIAMTARNLVNVASISAHLLSCWRRASDRAQTARSRIANGPLTREGRVQTRAGRFAIRIGKRATVVFPLTSEAATPTT